VRVKSSFAMSGFEIIILEECEMATIGQSLPVPEADWRRYSNTEPGFNYSGIWDKNGTGYHSTTKVNASVSFTFYGQQLRIIGSMNTLDSTNIRVTIDGVNYSFSCYASSLLTQRLVFEKINLPLEIHNVIITNLVDGKYFTFDSIDIDSAGYMIGAIKLVATAGDTQVALAWEAVTNATGYNVKRSTTAGGPYTTIATNVAGINYIDTAVQNGITYYYVVTAITAEGESANSNEASVTPIAAPVEDGQAILRVTMLDSSEREYQLPITEINGFANWHIHHVSTDTASYILNKKVGSQNSKEYLAFEKIISFEVIPVV
jgi:hypothetical protein